MGAIIRLGASSAATTTITIPGTYQNGDWIAIFAYRRNSATAPSLPSGWTSINSVSGSTNSAIAGWKFAGSASESSGTWSNATNIVCHVYRGIATNKVPRGGTAANTGSGTTLTFGSMNQPIANGFQCQGTSWVVGFAGVNAIDTTIDTAPTGLTNATSNLGASSEVAGHDSNGVAFSWPSTTQASGGTSASWATIVFELRAEFGNIENYKAVNVGDGLSTGERIY